MSSVTTRRGLLAGALATAATPVLAHAQLASRPRKFAAEFKLVRRGRAIAVAPRVGRIVVAHDRLRTIAVVGGGRRRIVDVGGQPLEIDASPNGRLAAITTAAWDEPGLAIVDLRRGKLVKRLDAGAAPFGVAFSADGKRIFVAGGDEEGEVRVIDADRLRTVGRGELGDSPRTVVVARDSEGAWIVLNGPDRVVRVDGKGKVRRSLATAALPERAAVSPDGKRLLVCHGGLDSDRVSEISVKSGKARRHKAGRQPSGVAWGKGETRVIALGGAGRILVIGREGRRKTHEAGGAPRGLAVAGNRAWTVDGLDGKIARVRL